LYGLSLKKSLGEQKLVLIVNKYMDVIKSIKRVFLFPENYITQCKFTESVKLSVK